MTHIDINHRGQWPSLLLAVPASRIHQAVSQLASSFAIEDIQLPQSGLGLLQLRDGALGQAYFAGETPLARAHVRLTTAHGVVAEGAAVILDDRAALARAIAILDAVLAAQLDGHDSVEPLLRDGALVLAQQRAQRAAMLAATRVNFSLMGDEEDDDD